MSVSHSFFSMHLSLCAFLIWTQRLFGPCVLSLTCTMFLLLLLLSIRVFVFPVVFFTSLRVCSVVRRASTTPLWIIKHSFSFLLFNKQALSSKICLATLVKSSWMNGQGPQQEAQQRRAQQKTDLANKRSTALTQAHSQTTCLIYPRRVCSTLSQSPLVSLAKPCISHWTFSVETSSPRSTRASPL